jgi:retron-type reverse transcriptase
MYFSCFRDRVVYHILVNIIEPIFEKIFIYDSYASRLNKGTHNAVKRFDYFKRKVTKNGKLVKNAKNNNMVKGYCLKADIKHYFETVDHENLLKIIKRKIKDDEIIWLIKKILNNFNTKTKGKGMLLVNLTSQFFANIYLNELDYFIKHKLKAKYYIRYVDDFVILHSSKKQLIKWKKQINNFLKKELKIELHKDKSKIKPLANGISFLGYRIFYHYKLLRKSNIRKFEKSFNEKLYLYKEGALTYDNLLESLQGWFGYSRWANTYKLSRRLS